MKKTLYHIGMLAAAALAFVACSKETEINQPKEEVTHVATISLGKADVSTKTEVIEGENSASYKWLEDDDQYLHVYENGTEGEITKFELSGDKTIATLTVSFTGTPTAPYTYTAKYAKNLSGSKNPLVPAEQYPKTDNFDPAADVLVSKASDDVTSLAERATEFAFTMGRVVTVNKMTLTGLEEGEVVSSVVFTLDKAFNGYASWDEANSTYKYTNGTKVLMIHYGINADGTTEGATDGTVGEGGTFPVYFTCAPVDAASIESVVVTTDKNVYTKAGKTETTDPFYGKTITFAIGTMKRFTMGLSGYGSPLGESVDYTLVEDDEMIVDGGEYLIVSTKKDNAGLCAAGSFNSSNYYDATDVTATNGVISVAEGSVVNVFTLEAGSTSGQFYIKDSDGKYLYWSSGNSVNAGTKGNTDVYLWTVAFNEGVLYITNVSTTERKLKYNSTSPRFACYTSAQTDISLYVDENSIIPDERTSVTLSFSPAEPDGINLGDSFTEPTLTVDPVAAASAVSYSVSTSPEGIATIDAETGELTITGVGTITVTAAIPSDNETYKPVSASYEVTVVDANANDGSAEKPYTASEAAELALGGSTASVYVKGIISSIATAYNSTNGNISFYISDDGLTTSTQFEIYKGVATSESQFLVGDYVVFSGNLTKYNSTPELAQGGTCSSQVKAPRFSIDSGNYASAQTLELSADNGASIYYTTDGTDPTTSSTEYSSAISIPETMTVKAFAVLNGITTGVVSRSYTIDASANDGSAEKPYTASEAAALATAGNTGSYYIYGTVTKIQNQYSASYGTANFWIDENGESQSVFEGYKIKYLGNVAWVDGNAEIAVGDEVVIYGTLTLYNTTPETSSGYLVSLNGKTKGLTPGTLTVTPDNDNKQITVTWGAATGTESTISYLVTCGTQTYNATAAGSHTFTMADYGVYNVAMEASANDAVAAKLNTSITLSDPKVTEKTYTIQWGSNYNSESVSSYTASWSVTYGGFTCNMANWNNNNNGWNYVKAGRMNYTSVATISTASAIPEAIKTVTLTIDAVTTNSINSLKLYTSSDNTSWTAAGSFTVATGDQSVVISSPAENMYYKVEADCASGSSNGLITVSKLVFTTN